MYRTDSSEDLVDKLMKKAVQAAKFWGYIPGGSWGAILNQEPELSGLRSEILKRMSPPALAKEGQENHEPLREGQISDFLDHSDHDE